MLLITPCAILGGRYWTIALTGVGIVLGLLLFGERVMSTVGTHLTLVTPSRGYCIELGAVCIASTS